MTGLEIEYFTITPLITAAASENLSSLEPTQKNKGIRSWYIKSLTVHLLMLQNKAFAYTFCDRMSGFHDPKTLSFSDLTPFEITCGPHKLFKYL